MHISCHRPLIILVFIIDNRLFIFTLDELILMMLEAINDLLAQRNAAIELYQYDDGSFRRTSRSTELVLAS